MVGLCPFAEPAVDIGAQTILQVFPLLTPPQGEGSSGTSGIDERF